MQGTRRKHYGESFFYDSGNILIFLQLIAFCIKKKMIAGSDSPGRKDKEGF